MNVDRKGERERENFIELKQKKKRQNFKKDIKIIT